MDRRIDLVLGLIVIALGFAVLFFAQDIRPTGPVVDPIGPRAFPYAIGVFFLIGGCRIVYIRLRDWRRTAGPMVLTDGEPDEADVPASAVQAFTIMTVSVLYALTLSTIGYVIATPLFVTVGLRTMRMRSWRVILSIAVIYTAATYLIFAYYMRVDLPLGPLTDLFRSLGLAR